MILIILIKGGKAMSDKIKDAEKIDVNNGLQAINEDDLGEVSGGGLVDTIKEKWQRFRMSRKEKEEIESLINEYSSLFRKLFDDYKSFNEDERYKMKERVSEIWTTLNIYANKYPNISELKFFSKSVKLPQNI